jgi:hypothetical protein
MRTKTYTKKEMAVFWNKDTEKFRREIKRREEMKKKGLVTLPYGAEYKS